MPRIVVSVFSFALLLLSSTAARADLANVAKVAANACIIAYEQGRIADDLLIGAGFKRGRKLRHAIGYSVDLEGEKRTIFGKKFGGLSILLPTKSVRAGRRKQCGIGLSGYQKDKSNLAYRMVQLTILTNGYVIERSGRRLSYSKGPQSIEVRGQIRHGRAGITLLYSSK